MSTKAFPFRVFCLSALTSVVLVSCKDNKPEVEDVVRPVKAMQVGVASSMEQAILSGKAKATQEINIAFEVSGRIVEFPVKVGDVVDKGGELARLDPKNYQSAVEVATAERDRSRAMLERVEKAFESKAVSAQTVTNAKAQAAAAAAALRIAEKSLEDTAISAPFAGRVAATYVENFENIIAKQKVLRLLDNSSIEMVVDVPENLIPNVPFVKSIEVTFSPFPEVKIPATVKEIGSEASELTRTYPVTLQMKQPENVTILPGMAGEAVATAELPPERMLKGIPILPSALTNGGSGDQSYVWVVDKESGAVSKTSVTVDRFSATGITITDGLSPGQWVVTAGVNSLTEGQKVRILSNE